ncbi:MAG: single-stranded DNA-binding protein [Anaerolineae bacterium]|nr:single-stranded DNA-binding protein [Anaerolineae bacterium]
MYQKITIVGNLGRDPEMRYTDDGTPVCDFSVATNRRWHRPDGSQGEETVWFRVTAWRRMAEACNQYLQKGRQVLVEGQLKPDEGGGPRVWTGNDGVARASYEVTALVVKFLGGRGGATGPNGEGEPESSVELSEEEIPF